MQLKLIPAAAALLAAVASFPTHAAALAAADITVSGLGVIDVSTGLPIPASYIQINSESRTGTAAANYNGVAATGVGAPSISSFTVGDTVDVGYRCAGDCGAGTAALYGGVLENNSATHLTPPPAANFALGDMKLEGSALASNTAFGLTRADAAATGPTNKGGANATILNSAEILANFTVEQSFTGSVVLLADAYLRAWVDSPAIAGQFSTAAAGYGFVLSLFDDTAGTSVLTFAPSQLNKTFSSTSSGGTPDKSFSFSGALSSVAAFFTGGHTYSLAINQSSNATVSVIPEPASIALLGAALMAAGVATRRSLKK